MRELKFRVWDTQNKCYVKNKNGGIEWSIWEFEHLGEYKDRVIIEQYTDEYDENDKEIAEGDIVTLNGEWEEIERGDCSIVTFENGCFRVGNGYENEAGSYLSDWRIIGNINENSELLEGKK